MLILTRRNQEGIIIGDDIEIRVLGIRGNEVRLGIKAPKSVRVDREEIRERIEEEERNFNR